VQCGDVKVCMIEFANEVGNFLKLLVPETRELIKQGVPNTGFHLSTIGGPWVVWYGVSVYDDSDFVQKDLRPI
jgi:hypothetical protein